MILVSRRIFRAWRKKFHQASHQDELTAVDPPKLIKSELLENIHKSHFHIDEFWIIRHFGYRFRLFVILAFSSWGSRILRNNFSSLWQVTLRGSLHPLFKIRTDSAVRGSLHFPLKIRTKSAVRESLRSPFQNLDWIGRPWILASPF